MATRVEQCRCPKCGGQGLLINTEDWKPVRIRCLRLKKCGWEVDLKQFWPKKETEP